MYLGSKYGTYLVGWEIKGDRRGGKAEVTTGDFAIGL
jgi:hypothetical protein